MQINWTIGVEIELLAPPGRSRRDLAAHLAARHSGHVRPYFLPQSEPSKVEGMDSFQNLTMAFAVEDRAGKTIARCVDDGGSPANIHVAAGASARPVSGREGAGWSLLRF